MHSFNVKTKSFGDKFHRKQIWLEIGANPYITTGPSYSYLEIRQQARLRRPNSLGSVH